MNKYQAALNRLNQDERYQQGDEKMILKELVDRATLMKVCNWLKNGSMACCPICNMSESYEEIIGGKSFCKDCGQAMDWE